MSTTIDIDEELLRKAMEISGIRTEKGIVEQAIREFVSNRTRKDFREFLGLPLLAEDYDYKEFRKGK